MYRLNVFRSSHIWWTVVRSNGFTRKGSFINGMYLDG